MSAADTVKEFARVVTTAGLAKNVIGLLDKKPSLLAEQVETSNELRIIYDTAWSATGCRSEQKLTAALLMFV
jgi:hypothetical protein